MKGNTILKTGAAGLAAALLVFLMSACPMDTPENTPSTYTITYSPGEGSGSIAPVIKKEGETIRLSDGTGFTAPEGKTFDNWKDGAGNAYAAGSSYSRNEDLSLTAQWKAVEVEEEIKKTVTITDLPVGYSTLAVYLSDVKPLSGSSDITAAGGLPSGGAISGGQVSYPLHRYSEGSASSSLWTGNGSYYVYLCWDGSSIATEVSTATISFDEESTTISYTGTFQSFIQKKVEVLNQSGSITAGTGGTATYQINRYNISTNTVTIKWYGDSAGTTVISAPAGISDNTGSLPAFATEGDHETSTITITVSAALPAGTYYFRAFMEGESYYSAVKSLSVGSAGGIGSFDASELAGWNVMVASAGDVDAVRVLNAYSYDGDSGKIHYDGGAKALTYWYNGAKRTASLASPADNAFHLLLANIGTGNEIRITSGKVGGLYKMQAAGWNINFDSIQNILSGSVTLGNWAADTTPVMIKGSFSGTLSLVGNHTDDAFAVPDSSTFTTLTTQGGSVLSFNSSSHLVLGINSSLVLTARPNYSSYMWGYGKVVAGQTEFSFGDVNSCWIGTIWSSLSSTGDVTITRTGTYTSSITATGGAGLMGLPSDTNSPVITQKQGNAGNSLTIECPVYLRSSPSTTKSSSMVLEGTGANKGLVRLGENGIIATNSSNPNDSMGSQGTSITGLLLISGGTYMLRKDTETGKFLFIRRDSGIIEMKPSDSADFELSAETPVN
jgi:hypothetical protein